MDALPHRPRWNLFPNGRPSGLSRGSGGGRVVPPGSAPLMRRPMAGSGRVTNLIVTGALPVGLAPRKDGAETLAGPAKRAQLEDEACPHQGERSVVLAASPHMFGLPCHRLFAHVDRNTPMEVLSPLSDLSGGSDEEMSLWEDKGGSEVDMGEESDELSHDEMSVDGDQGVLAEDEVVEDDDWMKDGLELLDEELRSVAEKRISEWATTSKNRRNAVVCNGRRRLAVKKVKEACIHGTIYMENFALLKAVEAKPTKAKCSKKAPVGKTKRGKGRATDPADEEPAKNEETKETVFDGTRPRRAVSKDNFDLVYHLTNAIDVNGEKHVREAAEAWGAKAKRSTKVANDKKGGYKTDGGLYGTTRFASLWHPIGHPHDDPVTASDILRTGATWEAACTCMSELQGLSAFVSSALKTIDPIQHDLLQKVHAFRRRRFQSQVALGTLDPHLIHEGREIVFNRFSFVHLDMQDPNLAWTSIYYFGYFDDAYLEFPELKLKVRLRPGDMVFFRGRNLLHTARLWSGGDRHFVVHFTHKAMWDLAGEVCATSPAKVWT